MNEGSYDNFEYLNLLAKNLSVGCRDSRKETDKIELLLKRLSKQSVVSYEEFSQRPSEETLDAYKKLSEPTTTEQLIRENYQLMYEIEQQEYINKRIIALVNSINEHLISIRNFIIEQKLARDQNNEIYMHENFTGRENLLKNSTELLKAREQCSRTNTEVVVEKFKKLYAEIDWDTLPSNLPDIIQVKEKIKHIKETYKLDL